MAGLLEEFGIDLDDVPDAPSYDVPDDTYQFVVGDMYIREGTDKKPDASWIIIEYMLGDGGSQKNEWFELPLDASNPTDKELTKLSFYKRRLISLGITPEEVNSAGPDDVVGKTGTLVVLTKGGYQNIVKVEVDEAPVEEAPVAAPKTRAARTPRAAVVEEEDASGPIAEEAPAKAAPKAPSAAQAATVKKNPFA